MRLLDTLRKDPVIFRFSLYGFLKNQEYYDPFWILAFREKGLSFLTIGLLISVREVTMNLFEVPSGAIADVLGRRAAMVFSFLCYIGSFALFALASDVTLLAAGMVAFGLGEAFRTGTHKSMIFAYLRHHGRLAEKTKIYGYTRSWSKFGSAVSVLFAAAFVLVTNDYVAIFYLAIIPYALNIVNFLGYPQEVDGEGRSSGSMKEVLRILVSSMKDSMRNSGLRRVLVESMGFEGTFKTVKDYLQPVLKAMSATGLAAVLVMDGLSGEQKAALVIAPVYFLLNFLSGIASRYAHRFSDHFGGHVLASRVLWGWQLLTFAILLPALYFEFYMTSIVAFTALHVLQNLWGPLMYSRLDDHAREEQGSTVLSIESQSVALATMVLAPMIGYGVDVVERLGAGGTFWPVGLVGLAVSLLFFGTAGGSGHERR